MLSAKQSIRTIYDTDIADLLNDFFPIKDGIFVGTRLLFLLGHNKNSSMSLIQLINIINKFELCAAKTYM